MAQSGYTPISLYYTTTAAAVPTSGNLVNGELAINITDGKLYYKNNSAVVTLLASSGGASGDVVGPASSTDNALARFDLATGKLIQNSVGLLSDAGILTGLTGVTSSGPITLSSLTSGRVPYAGTAGLLQDSANLTFNGTTLTANTIGAFTLSGTVAGGGNQLNNVIIGTTTPLAGNFTTVIATGAISGHAASRAVLDYSPGGGRIWGYGVNDSTIGEVSIQVRSSAGSLGGTSATFTSTGINSTAIGATTPSTGAFTTLSASGTFTSTATSNAVDLAQVVAKNAITLGSSGSNYGFISNVSSDSWALGYGPTKTTLGTSVIGWTTAGVTVTGTLSATGDSAFGASSTAGFRLYAKGASATSSDFALVIQNSTPTSLLTVRNDGQLGFGVSATAMILDSSGNLGLGVTPSAWSSPYKAVQLSAGAFIAGRTDGAEKAEMGANAYYNSGWKYLTSYYASRYVQDSSIHTWYTATSGTAGNAITFTAAMTLDASGNLGIGTTSPNCRLDVQGAVPIIRATDTNSTGAVSFQAYNNSLTSYFGRDNSAGTFFFNTAITPYSTVICAYNSTAPIVFGHQNVEMTLDASGNLLVGLTTSVAGASGRGTVQINGSSAALLGLAVGGSSAGYILHDGTNVDVFNSLNGYLRFGTNQTERARIDSSGNLLVGTTDANPNSGTGVKINAGTGARTSVVGAADTNANFAFTAYSTSPSAYRFQVGYGGTIYATSTSITAISDASLKTNVRDLETGLTEVLALQPRRFDWINGDASNVAGFIAQEVQQVLPDLVEDYQYSDEETKLGLKMGDILPTLVKAIQEQQAIITALTTRITALENK